MYIHIYIYIYITYVRSTSPPALKQGERETRGARVATESYYFSSNRIAIISTTYKIAIITTTNRIAIIITTTNRIYY